MQYPKFSMNWPLFFLISAFISHHLKFLNSSKYSPGSISNGFLAYPHTKMLCPHVSILIVTAYSSSFSLDSIFSKKHVMIPSAWAKFCVWYTAMLCKFFIILNIFLWICGNYLNVPLTVWRQQREQTILIWITLC